MREEDRALYEAAVSRWGFEAQTIIAMEECGELTQAISKFWRRQDNGTLSDLCEEIADVENMCSQLRYIMVKHLPHFTLDDVDGIIIATREDKMRRLKARLEAK
jgi:NTP pyrophosphatase (non-canonical NTP hydrolase)